MGATSVNGWFDVTAYGADPTGANDSATAFNQAAQAAKANGGGTVYVPPGTYLINSIVKLFSETVLQGNPGSSTSDDVSARSVLIAGALGSGTVNGNIMIANDGYDQNNQGKTWRDNIAVYDLAFNGTAGLNNRSWGNATLFFQGVKNVRIERCAVFNCANDAISVVSTPNPAQPAPQGNVWIRDCIIDVLPIRDSSYDLTSGNFAIRCEALNSVFIEGNVIGFNPPSTGYIPTWSNDAIDVPGCNWVNVTNNQIQWATDGVGLNNSVNAVVAGNIIYNCIGEGISSFAPSHLGVNYFNVVGNLIIGVPPNLIVSALSPMIFAIRATSATTTASQYVTICGNICVGPFADGAIDGNALNATISENQIDCMGTVSGGTHYPGVGIILKQSNCTAIGNTIRNQYGSGASVGAFHVNVGLQNIVIVGNNIDSSNSVALQFGSNTLPTGLIAENFGIITYPAFTQPSVSNSPVLNPAPFDCTVYLNPNGSTVKNVVVDGYDTGYSTTLNGTAVTPFRVKNGGTITLTYSGAATPTWVWVPD